MLKEIPVGKSKNLIGQKFGNLTVLYRTEPEKLQDSVFRVTFSCSKYMEGR